MKTINYFFLVLVTISSISKIVQAQGFNNSEFMIVNQTQSYNIMIKMYPIGPVFNGKKGQVKFSL